MNLEWGGGWKFEVGGSKHYHGGGRSSMDPTGYFLFIQVGGSVNEVWGGSTPNPHPHQNKHWVGGRNKIASILASRGGCV